MPKNRHSQSREEKTGELVDIALKLFLEKGYVGTTMAAIGSEAGIATNVVHWYFATKMSYSYQRSNLIKARA